MEGMSIFLFILHFWGDKQFRLFNLVDSHDGPYKKIPYSLHFFSNNIVLLRDVFNIGLVIGPRSAILA